MLLDQNEDQMEENENVRQNCSPASEGKEEFLIICSIINFLLTHRAHTNSGGTKRFNIKLALKPNNRRPGKKLGRLRPGDTFSQQMVRLIRRELNLEPDLIRWLSSSLPLITSHPLSLPGSSLSDFRRPILQLIALLEKNVKKLQKHTT